MTSRFPVHKNTRLFNIIGCHILLSLANVSKVKISQRFVGREKDFLRKGKIPTRGPRFCHIYLKGQGPFTTEDVLGSPGNPFQLSLILDIHGTPNPRSTRSSLPLCKLSGKHVWSQGLREDPFIQVTVCVSGTFLTVPSTGPTSLGKGLISGFRNWTGETPWVSTDIKGVKSLGHEVYSLQSSSSSFG